MPPLTIVDTPPQRRRVALYCRVSSEEQAERETIQDQVYRLRQLCAVEQLEVVEEYLDDGITGRIPFTGRPAGARLLRDAAARRFDMVLFLKVNRLARKLLYALEVAERLGELGVAIRSATETIDSSTSFGQAAFQMMGVFAELDRNSIIESTTRGRARGARNGRWYGVVPIGYTLEQGKLAENTAEVLPGLSEADLVRDIFRRIASGSTGMREAMRLSGLGLRPFKRYVNTKTGQIKEAVYDEEWRVERITRMIRRPQYKGEHTYHGKYGDQQQTVMALVDEDLWAAANRRLDRNQTRAPRATKYRYLLAGLIRCGTCGYSYIGTYDNKSARSYYQCSHLQAVPTTDDASPSLRRRCSGKALQVDELERAIWADCVGLIEHPDDTLELLTERHRERRRDALAAGNQRAILRAALASKDRERQTVIGLRRRDAITDAELDAQSAEIESERRTIEVELAVLEALLAQAEVDTKQAQAVQTLLGELRATVAQGFTFDSQQSIVRELVESITVHTEGTGRTKTARVRVVFKFGAAAARDHVGNSPRVCSTRLDYMTLERERLVGARAQAAGSVSASGLVVGSRQPSASSSARTIASGSGR